MSEASLMSPERDESVESNLETNITNTQSFEDLFLVLESVIEFPGGSKTYSKEEIITVVSEARESGDISRVPRAKGLRAKVSELVEAELAQN